MYSNRSGSRGIKKVDFPEDFELSLMEGPISVTAEMTPLTVADRVGGKSFLQPITISRVQTCCRKVIE